MLVLTRWQEQEIRINQAIHIKVIGVKGGRVRLGIEAPKEISIKRQALSLSKLDKNH